MPIISPESLDGTACFLTQYRAATVQEGIPDFLGNLFNLPTYILLELNTVMPEHSRNMAARLRN